MIGIKDKETKIKKETKGAHEAGWFALYYIVGTETKLFVTFNKIKLCPSYLPNPRFEDH